MGNTESNVTSGVKKQADTSSILIYKLVDTKGEGLLVELMKQANQIKDYTEIDHAIEKEVEPFLYNKGNGKKIPIWKLVLLRNKDRPRHKLLPLLRNMEDANDFDIDKDIPTPPEIEKLDKIEYREVCWDLKERGAVGETILHLCLLNATSTHADLAKRLLKLYPKLINDIYIGDEYYGESVLHMAIVNEDPVMVKFLLDSGADFHERCIGNFMGTEDQKASRTDSLLHEWVNLQPETNYEGYVYWGEYPLSFAACLNQEECYRLMLARGADPNNRDTNGNTVLHMLVIYKKMACFDTAYEIGADLNVKNVQNLTPLTLAAKIARVEMFFHILKIEREIYWQIGSITCAAYPLTQIDTIDNKNGKISNNSALNLVVFGDKDEHLELMDGVLMDLLNAKWNTFVKFRFYRQFFQFLLYFILSVICFTIRPGPPPQEVTQTTEANPITESQIVVEKDLHPYVDNSNHSVFVREIAVSVNNVSISNKSVDNSTSTSSSSASFKIQILNQTYPTAGLLYQDETISTVTASFETLSKNFTANIPNTTTSHVTDIITTTSHLTTTTPNTTISNITDIITTTLLTTDTPNTTTSLAPAELQNNIYSPITLSSILETAGEIYSTNSIHAVDTTILSANNDNVSESTLFEVDSNVSQVNANTFYEWWQENLGHCRLMIVNDYTDVFRLVIELTLEIGSLLYLLAAIREAGFLGLNMFIENLMTAPSRVMFLSSCLLMMIVPYLRFTCSDEIEDHIIVIIMLTTSPYFLFFCRGFKTVGPFVVMIYRMVIGDLLRFVSIYLIFVMGFSQAYYVIFLSYENPSPLNDDDDDTPKNPLPNPIESIMAMFLMSLNMFNEYYTVFERTQHEFVAKFCFVVFMVIVAILLVNMLIAMMGNTYQKIAETRNEWQRQWARIVLVVERGVNPAERLKKLMIYSQPMSDGRRALVLRLNQTEEDKEEMKEILEMKRTHYKNVQKLEQRNQKAQQNHQKVTDKIVF